MSDGFCLYAERVTPDQLAALAGDWIAYWHAPDGSPERAALSRATDLYELEYHDPETLWSLILAIHHKDQSIPIQQVLSAGPIENLLAKHGDAFIDRVESEARRDPSFAKVLGGVWRNSMSDSVWHRLQAVWDRRGWDGIPE
ncbi:MAG TPA: hypothetical protein VME68_09470 [Acidobacteriaceae bacterium]|nr:hypothetical protein [Acidobacteriaceae bacterium]